MAKCNLCGEEFKLPGEGVALMMAFLQHHTTSLINVAICDWCYHEYGMDDAIKTLNMSAELHIDLEEETDG